MGRSLAAFVAAAVSLCSPAAFAALAVDSTAAVSNQSCSGTVTSCQTGSNFTAAQSNELLVVVAVCNSTGTPSVTSISDNGPGLTWTKRTDQLNSNNYQSVWTAQASGSFSAKVTANFSGCGSSASVIVVIFGVQGAATSSPWDSNGALPAFSTGAASSTPTVGPISTTSANTIMFSFLSGTTNRTDPSGWSDVPSAHFMLNSNAQEQIIYKIVSSTQSSVTATYGATAPNAWETIGDAIDAPTTTGNPGSLMMLGVGQ